MTLPTQSDDGELDAILRDAIYIARYGDKTARTRLNEAKAKLHLWATKQRIEELERMPNYTDVNLQIRDRIAKLEAEMKGENND